MSESYIVAIHQGTTSSRAIVFNTSGEIISVSQDEFPQIYPTEGWVEHDPEAIWSTSLSVTQKAIKDAEAKGGKVVAIGITNQRETTIIWDRETNAPVYNAIVWQDRRTAAFCQDLKDQGKEKTIRHKTGLLLDPYFSASKAAWILDQDKNTRVRAEQGKLAFGTVDSFLLWRLTGGTSHATDVTNASRTSLYNIRENQWDEELCSLFNIPHSLLPEVKDCAADFGMTDPALFGRPIPVLGIAGDQQAAAIGQCCFEKGDIKSTYGTGCFVLVQTGEECLESQNRLLTTIAYRLNGKTAYALEGSIFVAGAAVQWLRDGIGLIEDAKETEALARSIDNTGGVYLVPAFTGLGAPHWSPEARGAIYGLTRSSGRAELTRAALESVAYQTYDLFAAFKEDGIEPTDLRIDGGMVMNNWLVEFLSGLLDMPIERPKVMETTALGVASLAALQAGIFSSLNDVSKMWQRDARFEPAMEKEERLALLNGWHKSVERTLA